MSDWPTLEIPVQGTDSELIEFCWRYFCRTYIKTEDGTPIVLRDWRGTPVHFSRFAHDHIVSGDSNYREGLGAHDIPFVPARAVRLPWIGRTLAGEAITEVRHQERASNRGRRLKRRVLIVTENSYVVVLDRQDDGCLRLRTAFPAEAAYLQRIRREGAQIEIHKPPAEKEKPQS